MASPEELEKEAEELEEEADVLEQQSRLIAAQGRVQKAKSLRVKAAFLQQQHAGGPMENFVPELLKDLKESSKEIVQQSNQDMVQQLQTAFEGLSDMIVKRIAHHQGLALNLGASSASTSKVLELLRRVSLDQSQDLSIPCCARVEDLPPLPARLIKYTWQAEEASDTEVQKGQRWLQKYICPDGTVAIPVQNQTWLEAHFHAEDARITASRTDFLITLDVPAVQQLPTNPTPEQLTGILRWIIGAYEVKTANFVRMRGILGIWPQAVLEALALNHRSDGRYFIPVFGGDFNEHLVLHAAPTPDDFMLHAATQSEPGQADLAVRYMRYLLEKSKEAVKTGLQGGGDSSDVDPLVSAPVYQLKGRSKKRGRELEEAAGGVSEGDEVEGAADADAVWQAAENAYHLDLVNLLRQPRMYRALGLSGPPHRIRHSSLEERLSNMQLIR